MNFEEALYIELNAITALNGNIFPLNADTDTKPPYLVYVSSEGEQERTLDGYVISKEVKCELHILNDTYFGLKDLTKQVISLIDTFQRRTIGGAGGVYIQSATYEKVHEQYVPELLQCLCILEMKVRI
jgi:hypothetical protein